MEAFRHDPIDLGGPAFRLLRLLKGQRGVICCEIFQAWLRQRADAITYEALSYVWGSTERKYKIEINGKHFDVTKNLYEALQYLQLRDQDRILWIDAVCIDQENIQERGHQVQHMGDIYRESQNVTCWLGLPTNLTRICLQSLRRLQEQSIRGGRRSCADWGPTDQRWVELWRGLDIGTPAMHQEGLCQLLDRSWFRRVWILQEVANSHAAEIRCGSKFVSARIFALAPFLMKVQPEIHCRAVLDIMPGPSRRESWWSQNRDLYTLLKNFGGSEASDPRDLVYALLGMSSDSPDIRPEYNKTEREVVKDVIDILYRFDIDCSSIPGPINIQELRSQLTNLNDIALEVAAGNQINGDEVMEFLLQHRSPSISVSGKTLRAAARNINKGRRMLERLLPYVESKTLRERSVIGSSGLIQAAVEVETGGDEVLELLLRYQGYHVPVTPESLEAAARNPLTGKRLIELLLLHRGGEFAISRG